MDKFKKAIDQLNKPVDGKNKDAKSDFAPLKRADAQAENPPEKSEPEKKLEELNTADPKESAAKSEINEPSAAKSVPEPEGETAAEPVTEAERLAPEGEMSEYEKELERQYYAARPESKPNDGKKAKKAKKIKKEKQEKKEKKELPKKSAEKKDDVKEESKSAPDKPEKPEKKSHGIRTLVIIAVIALAVIGCFANYRLNNQLKPVFYQVRSNRVVDNVRVVAISDMHLKEFGQNNEKLVDKIKSYHPDIIAIVGDMNIDKNPDYSKVINLCARLNEVAPLYYALGNHEFEAMLFEDSQIYYDLEAAGINVLNNETETLEVGLSEVDVIGLTQSPSSFTSEERKFFENAMEGDNFKLVLTHYPEYFQNGLEEYPIDLAICGHAHGGQVRLPFIGGLYSSDQGFFPKLCDGYHEIENSKVVITKGLGRSGVVPRINNPPEITIVDINWY